MMKKEVLYHTALLILGSLICSSFVMLNSMILFDFNNNSDISNWRVVNDVVMGGRSEAKFSLDVDGSGVFGGRVSLENNGGFSSLRHRMKKIQVGEYDTVVLRLRGDGKKYQFRVKESNWDRHSYILEFQTTDDWQEVEIPLSDMIPQFRGRRLAMPNFPGEEIQEIAFLIGNKKEETFKLELDFITLK